MFLAQILFCVFVIPFTSVYLRPLSKKMWDFQQKGKEKYCWLLSTSV